MTIEGEPAYTLQEVCEMLKEKGNNVNITMLKKYAKQGAIRTNKVDDIHYVKESDIDWGISAPKVSIFRLKT